MASGPAEEQPPALPVKQRRSHSSIFSSVESVCVELRHQNYTWDDVFESTDCHAAQCPIHQHCDPSRHHGRFFSDGTPPPVPKKRLARTLSFPVPTAPSLSPLSPLQRRPQDFDNPLYMLAPIHDTYFHKETEEPNPVRGSPVPSLSLSQLSFDTPDEHLPYLFSSFEDLRVVFQGIQHRNLLFLRSMSQSIDAEILLQGEAAERDINSYQPQDFLLCEGSEPRQIGDTVYCSLHSPKLPGRPLALRVHKQTAESFSAHTKHQPSHVNVQHVVAHFQPCNITRNNVLATGDPSHLFKQGCSAAKPPGGGSAEPATAHDLPSVQSFLLKGHTVSVERDLPRFTLEDFVQNSSMLQSADCLDYDRQVCLLLLQILMGLQHLHNIGASAAELRPQEIFLVWPCREEQEERNVVEQNASEIKTSRLKEEGWEKTEKKTKIQMLWRTYGSPRVVLTPVSTALHLPHTLIHMKSQIRDLIQYCFHSKESLTSLRSGPNLSKSSHRRGLLYLASVLQGDSSGPQMADMLASLQVLLWGPRVPLLNHMHSMTSSVNNWLTIKRALFVTKLAERGLIQDQSALDWEDSMCLKYLSFTDSEAVVSVTRQLWLNLNVD